MLPGGQGLWTSSGRSALTGGRMSPKVALDFLKEALAHKRNLVVAAGARKGRDRLGLDSYDQDEVLGALREEYLESVKPGKRVVGYHYSWKIPWRVPDEAGISERDCLIYVKFRIPPDESFVELASFKEDGAAWV